MITSQLEKLQGDDAEALQARERVPEPSRFTGDRVKVALTDRRRFALFRAVDAAVELSPIKTLTFYKTRVVAGSAVFFAWEYQGKIYL